MASPDRPASTPSERPPALSPDPTPPHPPGRPADHLAEPIAAPSSGPPPDFLAAPAVEHLAPVLRDLAAATAAALPARLAAVLEGRYTIERVLGSGGMAIVYLARDERHGRHVALKVVRPDLTVHPLEARRFVREVATTAPLVHPHIVPLHDSGEADGVPWYVMAYVEGESLRARLRREGPLPVAEAVRIASGVADALDWAHRHGVVHRDVKPENILFQDGHALVADFGIAHLMRGLLDGGTGGPATESLTVTGGVMGTAAYMSPEQASGESRIDGRSDVYALGCVLFEMLTGRAPFAGTTVEVLRQHLQAAPPAVKALRADVPAATAYAVARALAKRPADRFATAAEFAGALAAALAAPAVVRPRIAIIAAALLAIGSVAGLATWKAGLLARDPLLPAGVRVLVADLAGPASDSALGADVTQALYTDLGQSRRVHVVTQDEVREALRRMRRGDARRLDLALARDLAQRNGIAAVIDGEVRAYGPRYRLTARVVTADSGKVLFEAKETAESTESLLAAIDRLSERVRERIGEPLRQVRASPPLEQVTTGSLDALRKYTEAMRAVGEGDERRAAMLLEQAIALDTGFAMAYNQLSVIAANLGERRSRRIELRTRAYELRERLTERERLWLVGDYHNHLGVIFVPTKALDAYEELARIEIGRRRADALNAAALIYEQLRQFPRAADYLSRAIATDSSTSYQYSNLIRVQLSLGRLSDARVTADRMQRWAGSHQRFLEARSWIAFSAGHYDSARTFMQQLRQAHLTDPAVRATAADRLAGVALTLGQLRNALHWMQEAAAAERERGNAAAVLRWELGRAEVLIQFRGVTAGLVDSMEATLAKATSGLSAPSALDVAPSPEPLLVRAYTRLGRRERVRELVARWEEQRATRTRTIPADGRVDQSLHLGAGNMALAQGRATDALMHYRAAARTRYCVICAYPGLGRSFDALAISDSARAAYEAYVSTPFGRRDRLDPWHLAHALRRLGELYEDRDPARAASYYTRFIELWREADPELQPQVEEARRRLARLRSG